MTPRIDSTALIFGLCFAFVACLGFVSALIGGPTVGQDGGVWPLALIALGILALVANRHH